MFYDEKIETMSRAELNELQLERLKKAVKYAYENSAFYTKMFDNAKIKPEDIKSLDDLRKIPFISSFI